jgi:hypothetical protein
MKPGGGERRRRIGEKCRQGLGVENLSGLGSAHRQLPKALNRLKKGIRVEVALPVRVKHRERAMQLAHKAQLYPAIEHAEYLRAASARAVFDSAAARESLFIARP